MRLLKIKDSRLALLFTVIALGLHLAPAFIFVELLKRPMAPAWWQRSLKIYWPAVDVVQLLGLNINVGFLVGLVIMIFAALIQWWIIFRIGIWLVRLYLRKPPISNLSKAAVGLLTLAVIVFFYEASPEMLGISKYEQFLFDVRAGNVEKVKLALKHNPSYANKVRPGRGTALQEAALAGQADVVKLLIENGCDVAERNGEGETPLFTAVKWGGHEEVVKVLIAHKADVNARDNDGKTALFTAASSGYTNIVMLLLTNGADVNAHDKYENCPLSGAIINNRHSIVPLLLSNGANPNVSDLSGDTMLDRAALENSPALAEALLPYYTNWDSTNILIKGLSKAFYFGHINVAVPIAISTLRFERGSIFDNAYHGDEDAVRKELDSEPDLLNARDITGFSLLHRAVQGGQEFVVNLLLTKGVALNTTDHFGNTPLHWAVFLNESNIMDSLIIGNSNLNAKGAGGKTPLLLAFQQGYISEGETLLKHGANPNIASSNGETPLSIAVANGNAEEVKLLLGYHSDFGIRFHDDTLFHVWARRTPNLEVAEILLANGCDVNARGSEGQTPLLALAESAGREWNQEGRAEAVKWLLDHKADVNVKDDKGRTALSLLKWHNRGRIIERRKDISDILRKYGAKE